MYFLPPAPPHLFPFSLTLLLLCQKDRPANNNMEVNNGAPVKVE